MFRVEALSAVEILDSRSRPTLAVTVGLEDGVSARAGVPSGASTGTREAKELRDGDASRFEARGVTKAVGHVRGEIADRVVGAPFETLADLDEALIALDATPDKSRLGANAIVGVSIAVARALAQAAGQPLWRTLTVAGANPRLPVPHFNVVNGGVHAPNRLDFQEFMIAPLGAPNEAEAIRAGSEIYGALRRILSGRGFATGLGDEGGFAPELATPEEVLAVLVEAIDEAGYRTGRDGVALAMDPASSEFFIDGTYRVSGEALSSDDMIDRYTHMVDRYPVWLIEDGLAENDWGGWQRLTGKLGRRVRLVGDDILCTNPAIISRAIEQGVGNAALIKVNQIGTVTETLEAMTICQRAGWAQFVSHRSGETEDTFIADLAVGTGCGQIKSGAPARGERVAKYNRLIELEVAESLPYGIV
jgi:enolase